MHTSLDQIDLDLSRLPTNVREFVSAELEKCRVHNFTTVLSKTRSVYYKESCCAGYVDAEDKIFAVSIFGNMNRWLATFVHESCHVDQFIENSPYWTQMINGEDATELFDDWLESKLELDPETLKLTIDAMVGVELDCEKRSVEKIKKYNLPIKIDTYIRKSNAYVWSHRLLAETRDWNNSSLYESAKVWRAMPKTFDNNYDCLPDNIRDIFYSDIENYSGFPVCKE